MRRAVRVEKTVHTEVSVVHLFAVVAAVGIFILCVFVINTVICPFPDTAAAKLIAPLDDFPIILKRAGTDAHCVAVFAKEIRLPLIA